MTANEWIRSSLGDEQLRRASNEANRRRLGLAFGIEGLSQLADAELGFAANALELRVYSLLDAEDELLRSAAAEAFQLARAVRRSADPLVAATRLVRLGCLGVLGDRGADSRRLLSEQALPPVPSHPASWGDRVAGTVFNIWLRLIRKQGWADLDGVQAGVASLRAAQAEAEPAFLTDAENNRDTRPAWHLISLYHLAKAAELLAVYLSEGSVEGRYDIREQLEAQFDRAVAAASQGELIERESLARLLARTARALVDNSIWTVTRGSSTRITQFVQSLADRTRESPILEMLPPQRRTLREGGLLGSSHRSVVVSLPTSSGKTFIALFRILQALSQFEEESGWVAYVAPTRALVNQLTVRLRRDLGLVVEKVSPALEIDGLESAMLTETDRTQRFRVLCTTPEKLDLMLRSGWEAKIGRPLTLVVVDEAHGLGAESRGLKLELLLATINRECRHAQFLLLTPFIENADDIARWLSPDSNKAISLSTDWTPNDRVVVIARAEKGQDRGDFRIRLRSRHTTRGTIEIPEGLTVGGSRPLGLSWSSVHNTTYKIAAATAQVLQGRGTVIVLADSPATTWRLADTFKIEANHRPTDTGDVAHIKRFIQEEMGHAFPLAELLDYGIGVHHGGMSDDTRGLVEWLTERGALRALIATTTIAQGVNFPVSGVVLASTQYRYSRHPFRKNMPPQDFWNVAGRAGRVDQGELGVVALVAKDDAHQTQLESFLAEAVSDLNSTLIDMVQKAVETGRILQLETLSYEPNWSAFVQYLSHSYRQVGNHELFAAQVEQVLRGTLGFQELRRSNRGWADQLVRGVYNYAERIRGKPLKLVDATGFSWESVANTLVRLGEARVTSEVWTPELFTSGADDLQRIMGILLQVPELRESLREVTGGPQPDGDALAQIVSDWVQGRPLTEMATAHFGRQRDTSEGEQDSAAAMTNCCRSVFGRLTQTASWGLAALQSLTLSDSLDDIPAEQQRLIRNLPARVYYGVNSDEAVALRMLGVPRTAAEPLARSLGIDASAPLSAVRTRLRGTDVASWTSALGSRGETYHRVWSILEGDRH